MSSAGATTPKETPAWTRPGAASQRARWAQRRGELSYHEAASFARGLLYGGANRESALFAVAVALRLAPADQRHVWLKWAEVLKSGRRFKVSVFPCRFLLLVDEQLVAEIEGCFEE